MTTEHVAEIVRGMVSRAAGRPLGPDQVDCAARLSEDYGIDSMSLVSLLVDIERAFNIRIPDEQLSAFATVGALIDCVTAKTGVSAQ